MIVYTYIKYIKYTHPNLNVLNVSSAGYYRTVEHEPHNIAICSGVRIRSLCWITVKYYLVWFFIHAFFNSVPYKYLPLNPYKWAIGYIWNKNTFKMIPCILRIKTIINLLSKNEMFIFRWCTFNSVNTYLKSCVIMRHRSTTYAKLYICINSVKVFVFIVNFLIHVPMV